MPAPLNPPIGSWRDRRVWLVGASSGIGEALARRLLAAGARVALSARRAAPLAELAGAAASASHALVLPMDVTDVASVRAAHDRLLSQWGGVDLAIWVAGTYSAMSADDFDLEAALAIVETNLDGALHGLQVLLPTLRRQRSGGVALVSSVAGYRGLPKSLAYGPTKAALINLAESLYLDLHPLGVGVYLVNPGFVETPLTARNDFRMPALITSDEAAARILDGLARGRFEIHFPARFTLALNLLRLLPYRLYFAAIRRITGVGREAQPEPRPKDALR
jgi:NAD(P)-dependent dehydrogenase (short-subunit alcohol dehydrogenase family)